MGDSDMLGAFGSLINAMGGGGDRGNMFPQSDADDFSAGARFIPGQVTLDRRAGKTVHFVHECGPCCWYWEFEDGSRTYHYERFAYDQIGRANHGDAWSSGEGSKTLAGPCPDCGNEHTNGGHHAATTTAS